MDLNGFDDLILEGRRLLREPDGDRTQRAFAAWDDRVSEWLNGRAPRSTYAEWSGLPAPRLDLVARAWPRALLMDEYRKIVQDRLGWLSRIVETGESSMETTASNKVFVVHGHHGEMRESVARFLERLGLDPIVLHERASRGATIIQKIEENADVGFAVVILTGDDKGGTRDLEPGAQLPRARQNVVLELGYFIGKLGRARVCALYEEGVELPSDFQGVVYVVIDRAGAWKMLLARELRAAGFTIDLNRVDL